MARLFQERFRLLQVLGVKPFGEPAVDLTRPLWDTGLTCHFPFAIWDAGRCQLHVASERRYFWCLPAVASSR